MLPAGRHEVAVAENPGLRLDLPAGALERLAQAASVEDEHLAAVAARVEPCQRGRDEEQWHTDGVEEEQLLGDPTHSFQRPDRILERLQHPAHEGEVELALEVVNAALLVTH